MRHAPVAAIHLVGGEATQEALYQQHLEYLKTHFGISIQPPSHTDEWSWPSTASLSPCPNPFQHIELKQGYIPPKPKPRFTGAQTSCAPTSQGPMWQPVDPTEQFFAQARDTAKRQIVVAACLSFPALSTYLLSQQK